MIIDFQRDFALKVAIRRLRLEWVKPSSRPRGDCSTRAPSRDLVVHTREASADVSDCSPGSAAQRKRAVEIGTVGRWAGS